MLEWGERKASANRITAHGSVIRPANHMLSGILGQVESGPFQPIRVPISERSKFRIHTLPMALSGAAGAFQHPI